MNTSEISLIISGIALVCTLVNTFGGSNRRHKEDIDADNKRQLEIEKQFVKINVKLDDFCDTTKELMKQNEKENDRTQALTEQMIKVNERVETLFKYKDDHEQRISMLEDKVK
jgi:hypothetical protein